MTSKRELLFLGKGSELGHRRRAEAALRHIDDAHEADRVERVVDDAQVREDVLDLLAVVELEAADHRVRDARAHERLLDDARLGVRAVEDGDVTVGGVEDRALLHDGRRDELRLVAFVHRLVRGQLLARRVLRPELLGLAVHIVLDDGIGRREDVLRRAVVLLELDDRRLRVVLLEVHDVADIGAAPAVDGLVGIADDAEVVVARRENLRELVLRAVRVLILVDEDVAEAA